MRIECPFCGRRDSSEFAYLGADLARPDPQHPTAAAQFYEFVYLRDNPAGLHDELWYHAGGCRGWLRVKRDTRTHEIFETSLASRSGM
jgi:sarcosine oxidase subunit delta